MKLKYTVILFIFALVTSVSALTYCPRCNYRIGSDFYKCPKCLLNLKYTYSQVKEVKSTITVRQGYDSFIRHPHTDNRAYKADRNSGGDKTGEIGVWGGPCNLRFLIYFDIESAMKELNIDFKSFNPKRAILYISALPNKSKLELPVAVYPLTKKFLPGYDEFRKRNKLANGCTWYNATSVMPWDYEGGDYDHNCVSRGIIKSGSKNAIDVTDVINYFYQHSKENDEWEAPGLIIMSDATNISISSGIVKVYSFDAENPCLRPELYIQ